MQVIYFGVKQRVIIEAKLPTNPLALGEDFGCMGVFFCWHMPGLFEERHVDH